MQLKAAVGARQLDFSTTLPGPRHIYAFAQWTIEMVLLEPWIDATRMKDMPTFQSPELVLIHPHIQADSTAKDEKSHEKPSESLWELTTHPLISYHET